MSIHDDEPLWSVYRHVSPSGKSYIGVTKDIKHRWRGKGNGYKGGTDIYDAIQRYGWDNFEHEIIASGLTRSEAYDMESSLIDKYNTTNPEYGYNLATGGLHPTFSEMFSKRLSASLMRHPVSDKVKTALREANRKPIICLETKEIFESGQDAANKMNLCRTSILKAANGRQNTCGGYHFAGLDDYKKGEIKQFVPAEPIYNRVRCITTGEEYDNVCDASRKTGLSRRAISYACNGVHETCGGMKWEFIQKEGD